MKYLKMAIISIIMLNFQFQITYCRLWTRLFSPVNSKGLLAVKSLALCIQMQRPVHPDCGPNYLEHCSLQSMHQPPFPFPHPNPPCPSPQNRFPFRPLCFLRPHCRLRRQPSPFPRRTQGVRRNAPTKRRISKCCTFWLLAKRASRRSSPGVPASWVGPLEAQLGHYCVHARRSSCGCQPR